MSILVPRDWAASAWSSSLRVLLAAVLVAVALMAASPVIAAPLSLAPAAPAVLLPSGDGSRDAVVQARGTTLLYDAMDDTIASADDGATYVQNKQATSGRCFALLSDVPTDFASMTSVSVEIRARTQGRIDDMTTVYAQLFASDETTPLSSEAAVATNPGTSAWTTISGIAFGGITAGTKSVWDGARLRLRIAYTPVGTADSTQVRITAIEVKGSYATGSSTTADPTTLATDTTPPGLSSATVNGATVTLSYGEPLDAGSVPPKSAFALTVNGSAGPAVSGVSIEAQAAILNLEASLAGADTATIDYTPPTSNPLQDVAGNDATALYGQSVTNETAAQPVATVTPSSSSGATVPTKGIWLTQAELDSLPTSGTAWEAVKAAADGSLGTPNIADQSSDHDVRTLAVALVYARTGTSSYRVKAANAIMSAIGTEAGGRTLALARNLTAYVIAADLIDLKGYDAAKESQFRSWLSGVRTNTLDGDTLVSTHELRANNWGTAAGAARIAADEYLGDVSDLARAATVFQGWLGDRSKYGGFNFGGLSWQADPANPVGINKKGALIQGKNVDGVLPDDQRRSGGFTWPAPQESYVWGALGPAYVQGELLQHAGYPAYSWSDSALKRAMDWLHYVNLFPASGDDGWVPWIANKAYGTSYPAPSRTNGKVMGWTAWTHAR